MTSHTVTAGPGEVTIVVRDKADLTALTVALPVFGTLRRDLHHAKHEAWPAVTQTALTLETQP